MRSSHLALLGLAATLTVGGLIGLAQPAVAVACDASGASVTCTFSNPGSAETFVVPASVTSAQFSLRGGSGGHGGSPPLNGPADGGVGGGGATVSATVPLTPGSTLRIYVGGLGGDGQTSPASCETGDQGGAGGLSGGIKTGGDGGDGFRPMSDMGCAAGGGGGGTFVMAGGQTLGQVTLDSGGAVPLLVAGGGGGGGGGSEMVAGNGGNGGGTSGATAGAPPTTPGPGPYGGAPGATGSVSGGEGVQAVTGPPAADDAGGGGGGGYAGGAGGGLTSGGGGGAGLSPGDAVVGTGPAGAPGSVTITFSAKDTDACAADEAKCVVEPPPGEETKFKIVATGGTDGAELFAILNGGLPPTCRSTGGELSPDWVQFGFENAKDGRTWSKRIRVTGTQPAAKASAQHELALTQICFAAPYKFVVKRGEKLTRPAGSKNWEGLLAHCKSDVVAEARRANPDLPRPCILNRQLVAKGDGFVVRVNYFVPNGELDPQGRSLKKKKKRRS